MAKFYIESDEWYPVYTLDVREDCCQDGEIELTAEEVADYEATLKKFRDWQRRLRKAVDHER